MKLLRRRNILPAALVISSFACLASLAMFTDPLNSVGVAVIFFVTLMIFLAGLGYIVTLIQSGQVSPKSRQRIFGLSIFLVVLLMFRSVGSLSWVGGLILLLIAGGWFFYVSRRA